MPAGPAWWHLTVDANARTGPGTTYPSKGVQPAGHNFAVVDSRRVGSYTWLHTDHDVWYRSDLAVKGKATRIGERPESPVPGHGPGYAYGVRDSHYAAGWHTGQDYPASTGTPYVAVVSGRIARYVGGAYGKGLMLRGDDGHEWLYAHSSRRRFMPGKRVKRGQVIGYVGTTGNVTGPHLHLEKSRGARWAYADVTKPVW